jgi:hypothetical protein
VRPDELRAWVSSGPSFDELCAAFPAEWGQVQGELATLVARSDTAELQAYVARLSADGDVRAPGRAAARRDDEALSALVRRQMAITALRKHCLAAATGVTSGTVRFNLVNGWLAQRLLFRRGLERKPVSMRRLRLVWPLVWQRDRLMPLVQPRGMYCFYSRELVDALAELIAGRPCLEIAAGDGTLTRFLRERGVEVTASDNRSWHQQLEYPEWVVREEARESLRRRSPQVVLCSWPPAGNAIERHVFRTPSVQLYVVIGSRHRFASGDWRAYEEQTAFELEERPDLARLVVPPELESAVLVFRRRAAT